MNLACTTIAGRHLAQRERERARDALLAAENQAREELAATFARHGLTTHSHLAPELGIERSIWVDCRLDSCATDHAFVYAVLDDLGWQPDCTRLSRTSQRYDIVRLRHKATAARVVVIIKTPMGSVPQWEAA